MLFRSSESQRDSISSLTGGTPAQAETEYQANLNSFNDKVDENREFKTEYLESKFRRQISPNLDSRFTNAVTRINSALDSAVVDSEEELDQYSQAMNSFDETALGVKVDAVFDVVIDFAIDYTLDYFGADDLLARLQNYPIVDFVEIGRAHV